jgi:hypothetical protein
VQLVLKVLLGAGGAQQRPECPDQPDGPAKHGNNIALLSTADKSSPASSSPAVNRGSIGPDFHQLPLTVPVLPVTEQDQL